MTLADVIGTGIVGLVVGIILGLIWGGGLQNLWWRELLNTTGAGRFIVRDPVSGRTEHQVAVIRDGRVFGWRDSVSNDETIYRV